MSRSEKQQQAFLEEMGRLSFQYGCGFEKGDYGSLNAIRPDALLSATRRQSIARTTVRQMAEKAHYSSTSRKRYINELRAANATFNATQAALSSVDSAALESARGEAFMSLFHAGLDAHPAYTAVAEATSEKELKTALASVEQSEMVLVAV